MIKIDSIVIRESSEQPAMYIVTRDNPYYPSVEYFDTIEEANSERDNIINSMSSESGKHDCKVSVALVIETTSIKSNY